MAPKGKRRVAIYLRCSTDKQSVETQRQALTDAAAQRGWTILGEYSDPGVSGAKGRAERPGLDRLLKDVARGKFDVVMAWAVDRLGRSLIDLISVLQELHSVKCDLYLHTQGIDTTTPGGKAMFQMMGVFAEFERSLIQSRVIAGVERAKAEGKHCGRPRIPEETEAAIRDRLAAGAGVLRVAKEIGCGTGTVQRIKVAMMVEAA